MKKFGLYLLNILIAFDEFWNAVFLGSPHETISQRLGRNFPNSIVANVVDFIFFWTPNHCEEVAKNGDSGRAVSL